MGGLWDDEEEGATSDTNYYVLFTTLDKYCAKISSEPKLPPRYGNWMTGSRIDIEIPQPLIYEIEEEDEGNMRPYFEEPGAPLMSDELIGALRDAGVDNLDTYEAVIREVRTGREYKNYKAVNIVGIISGADMTKSDYTDSGLSDEASGDLWFDKLVLDETKLAGNLFFRLAENVAIVLASRRVVDVVRAAAIPGGEYLEFAPPEDYSG